MTRHHFLYIKSTVVDLQSAIRHNCDSLIDLNYGILLGICSCGSKIDSSLCRILIDIFTFSKDEFLKINAEDINLDDVLRIYRFRNSLF